MFINHRNKPPAIMNILVTSGNACSINDLI